MTGLVVVVYLELETHALAERNNYDSIDAVLVILAFVQCLKHVRLDGITTETAQTVAHYVFVILPDVCVQGLYGLKLLRLQRFLLRFVQDLDSFVLRQTGLQLLVGQTSFLQHLFLRSRLEEEQQRIGVRCEHTFLVMELYLCRTQIHQMFDNRYLTLCAGVLEFDRGSNARYTEVAHQYCSYAEQANNNCS